MELPIPEPLKNLWELWEIRTCILISMFLQCFLIVSSPFRKKVKNIWLYMLIWSAYLLADAVATFTVGLISSTQGDKSCNKKSETNPDIFAFWASFLLVHLGGPDTITAFALEDNELWRRHLVTLIFQSVSALYVFYQTLPDNPLWIPTVLMFLSGVVKYGERTASLFLASLDTFRDKTLRDPDPGPNYAKLMNEYDAMKRANLPTSIRMFNQPLENKTVNKVNTGGLVPTEIVLNAYNLFQRFKGIIVDIILSFQERNQSRDFFSKREAKDAFAVVETELNFMYDVLFTKVPIVFNKCSYAIRFICSALAITSLCIFYFDRKANFKSSDVIITYTLLLGAISLDVLAFFFLVCSHWRVVTIHKLPPVDIKLNGSNGTNNTGRLGLCRVVHRRWSESISSYNLIAYSRRLRNKHVEKVLEFFGLTTFVDGIWFVENKQFNEDLMEHIFQELKVKSDIADDLETAKELSAAKGDWALQEEDCNDLQKYVLGVDYDQSLLLWHIATELCYQHEPVPEAEHDKKAREISKSLSDYMLYLLVMQPAMMSTVAGIGEIRFRDTCAEAYKFFMSTKDNKNQRWMDRYCGYNKIMSGCYTGSSEIEEDKEKNGYCGYNKIMSSCYTGSSEKEEEKEKEKEKKKKKQKEKEKEKHKQFCKNIWDVPTEVKPGTVKGEKSKSVLFDGCILAKALMNGKSTEGKKWKVMSRVWVEMLSYAAINCRATTHAQQLPKGGELLTVVWLLMIQFGLGSQFQIDEGHARAKLTVGK